MIRKRLVTVLTVNDGVLFRTRNFIPDYRYTLNFIDTWSVDEIVLLDITRPGNGERDNFYDVVKLVAANCFVPLTVGGGVRSVEDVRMLLSIGADKVAINTEALARPEFIHEAARQFGSQCVVVSIDVVKNEECAYEVVSEFGQKRQAIDPVSWAQIVQKHGAGEIIVQSVDKDGTLEGYDNTLNKHVSEAVGIPVLACSGAGCWQHFVEGFRDGKVAAVCTTNIYHFTESSIKSAKQYLSKAAVDVRI